MWTWIALLGIVLSINGVWSEETEVLVAAGSLAVLPCATGISTQMAMTVQWMKGSQSSTLSRIWQMGTSGIELRGMGVGQRSRCPRTNSGKGEFNLQIDNVRNEDGGVYICTVTGRDVMIQRQVTLRVIQVSFSSHQPVEGSHVKITCDIFPSIMNPTVYWKFNQTPFLLERPYKMPKGIGNGLKEINIAGITPRHTGNWTCIIQYKGQEGNATQSLTVMGITSPVSEITDIYAEVGSSALLPCVYSTGLTPEDSSWMREQEGPGHSMGLPPSFSTSPLSVKTPWDKSAWIERVEAGDEGLYMCLGSVQRNRVERRLQLVTAQILETAGTGNGALVLTCHVSNTTGITRYDWVRVTYDTNGNEEVTPFHWEKTIKIKQMNGNTKYLCRYFGENGILGNATLNSYITSAQVQGRKSGTLSAGMITVLVVLLVIVLLVVLQLYKNQRRRKMILPYPALETIIHSSYNAQELSERNREDPKKQTEQKPN